ncbi:hypothetical protein ACFQHV_01130 [Promicromonospora thailandica]|uniref:Uncharacterized protein n=1 Tax=Promicromonospora thailandica TaxID=765201 RepID=A0A9X2G4T4_9MICO|nr:hypothetical protein [Promicromonospora thailandica]MCP2265543.1 hypothetical protein [Promicromonospora thailandica]
MSATEQQLAYASHALEATRRAREDRARHHALSIAETAMTMAEARRLLPYVIAAHGDTPSLQKKRRDALERDIDHRRRNAA